MISGCLNLSGAWVGRTVGPTPDNPKGFFENHQIREKIVKSYIHSYGFDKLGQSPLPPIQEHLGPQDYHHSAFIKTQVNEILKSEGYQGERWLYKDAKLALIWSIWAASYPNAKWILVRRKGEQIAQSCMKTGFMRAYSTEVDWLGWVVEYERRFVALKANCLVYEIWFEDMVAGKLDTLEATIKSCGLEWDEDKIKDFIIRR